MKKIVVLISGSGSNLQAIIDTIKDGNIDGKIVKVISNRPDAYGLIRAFKSGIANEAIDHKNYADRMAFDAALMQSIDEVQPDIIVLAGFMRILTDEFVQRYVGKLINIHPSLLPKYKGLHTHKKAIEAGDSHHGASVHFVTPELDDGPVIVQGKVAIMDSDTVETLTRKVHQVEYKIYPAALSWLCQNRIQWRGNTVFFDNEPLTESGYLWQPD